MVSRGQYSKRCVTCKKRKVKCDEQRPACARCQRSGLPCGYVNHVEFVDETPRIRHDSKTLTRKQQQQQQQQQTSADHQHIRVLLPPEEDIFSAQLLSRLTPSSETPLLSPKTFLPRVIVGLGQQSSELHRDCAQALTTAYFGKMNYDRGVFERGRGLYGRALAQLRQALQAPALEVGSDLLLSVLCLCVYENVVFSDPLAWLRHWEGVSRLIYLRGPHRHRDGIGREILRFARFTIVMCANIRRRHCYLSRPEWRTLQLDPWADKEDGNVDEILYDIFSDVPGILHDLDDLRQQEEAPAETFDALRLRTERTLKALITWPSPPTAKKQLCQKPFDPSTGIGADAAGFALRNAMIISLAEPCNAMDIPLLPSRTNDKSKPAAVMKMLAVEIGDLATSAVRPESSSSEAFFFLYPLQVAAKVLQPGSAEVRRIEDLMDKMLAGTHGFEAGRRRHWHLDPRT